MATTAEKTNPKLWDEVKTTVTKGDKGGKPGQWSARKAQLATADYKKRGGGYKGPKRSDNHLSEWTREEWGTKSGAKSGETGERYLPKKARATITDKEYARTTAKKRADSAQGKQFSRQPADVAKKAARVRLDTLNRTELMDRARARGIAGRSRMRKDDLIEALRRR